MGRMREMWVGKMTRENNLERGKKKIKNRDGWEEVGER